jgi:hypothetical protein
MRIIVPSCVEYRQTWQPHRLFAEMFWPECPWKRTLVTDQVLQQRDAAGFHEVIALGDDKGWCENLHAALARIPDDVVFMMLDDCWIDEPVNNRFVMWAAEYMAAHSEVAAFRMHPCPPADENFSPDGVFGEIKRGTLYRVSTCQGFWRREYLMNILAQYTSPSHFETRGSGFSDKQPGAILSPTKWFFPMRGLYSAIQRGCWTVGPVARAKALGIPVDTTGRPFGPG